MLRRGWRSRCLPCVPLIADVVTRTSDVGGKRRDGRGASNVQALRNWAPTPAQAASAQPYGLAWTGVEPCLATRCRRSSYVSRATQNGHSLRLPYRGAGGTRTRVRGIMRSSCRSRRPGHRWSSSGYAFRHLSPLPHHPWTFCGLDAERPPVAARPKRQLGNRTRSDRGNAFPSIHTVPGGLV